LAGMSIGFVMKDELTIYQLHYWFSHITLCCKSTPDEMEKC
jgi:hypothetical protein